jgi:phosphotransferase system enzyme I (PtsI)
LYEYGQLAKIKASLDEKLREVQSQPAVTLDGRTIHLSANIEDQHDVKAVKAHGAEGVGLFRTEFLFINREHPPTEEEQYAVYREVASALKPHSVIIRTLDLGGDKFASHLQLAQEMNPFLGWRAIRFCLAQRRGQHPDDVSDDFRPGRIDPGQCAGGKVQGGIARRTGSLRRNAGNRRDD